MSVLEKEKWLLGEREGTFRNFVSNHQKQTDYNLWGLTFVKKPELQNFLCPEKLVF